MSMSRPDTVQAEEPSPIGPVKTERVRKRPPAGQADLSIGLFIVVCTVLLFLILLLTFSMYFQYQTYRLAITKALEIGSGDQSGVITYLRAWDFAVVKVSTVFLSFLLIFTGALYVLRNADAAFTATAETASAKGSLNTSSPGLVMVTLGVILAISVIYSRTLVQYSPPAQAVSPSGGEVKQSSGDEPKLATPLGLGTGKVNAIDGGPK